MVQVGEVDLVVVADLKLSPQLGPLSGLGLPRPVGQTLGGERKERLRDTGGPGEESSLLLVSSHSHSQY